MNIFEEGLILSLWVLYEALLSVLSLVLDEKRSHRRRHRRWWIKPIIRQRQKEGTHHLLLSKTPSDGFYYEKYLRMSKENFISLLAKTSARIAKSDTRFRQAIRPEVKLSATLRFLATGNKAIKLYYVHIESNQHSSHLSP